MRFGRPKSDVGSRATVVGPPFLVAISALKQRIAAAYASHRHVGYGSCAVPVAPFPAHVLRRPVV